MRPVRRERTGRRTAAAAYQGGAERTGVRHPGAEPRLERRRHAVELDDCRGIAANDNDTKQTSTSPKRAAALDPDYTQVAGQEAKNKQDADADATAKQIGPKNDASSIRVLSPGDNGDVTQSNSATAGALAANDNKTEQTVDQSQTGGGKGSDYTQIAGQSAENNQKRGRRREGRSAQSEQHGDLDPRAEPRRRR